MQSIRKNNNPSTNLKYPLNPDKIEFNNQHFYLLLRDFFNTLIPIPMEKKILSFLFSTRLMAFLFLSYAVAMAIGTFIESEYNTDTARILIYNTKWFEAIHVFFLINFIPFYSFVYV